MLQYRFSVEYWSGIAQVVQMDCRVYSTKSQLLTTGLLSTFHQIGSAKHLGVFFVLFFVFLKFITVVCGRIVKAACIVSIFLYIALAHALPPLSWNV